MTSLRTSSYTIYVDLPWTTNVLLVHGYSGAFDIVDGDVARYLRARDTGPFAKPLYGKWRDEPSAAPACEPGEALVAHLTKRGFLTPLDPDQEHARFTGVVDILVNKTKRAQPMFVVMPTYGCNLRCGYCFQDHMRTDPNYAHLLRTMEPAMYDRILTMMDEVEAKVPTDAPREVTLFGGEPLLRENRGIIEYILTRTMERRPTVFRAISNATELDAYTDLLAEDRISWIQITIDGVPEAHDQRRIHADGSGSFAQTAANIDLCLRQGVEVSARINVDRRNVEALPALARVLVDRGWTSHPKFSVGVEAVTGSTSTMDKRDLFTSWSLTKRLAELGKQHPEMSVISGPSGDIESELFDVFSGGMSPYSMMRETFCGAQSSMYVLDCFGDVYACWERTGDKNVRIGWVDEAGKLRLTKETEPEDTRRRLPVIRSAPTTHAAWQRRNVAINDTCSRCRYALHCGGGCAIGALEIGGDFYGNFCDGFQSTFRNAAARAYRAFLDGVRPGPRSRSLCGS